MEFNEMGISVAPLGLAEQAYPFTTGWRPWLMTCAPAGAVLSITCLT